MPQPAGRRLRRRLWGIAPPEAERRLREQADQFTLDLRQLQEAIAQAQAEEAALAAECAALEAQVHEARAQLDRLRKGLARHRALAPIQTLVVAREIADLEQEHAARMAAVRAEEERVRAEIAMRRASLQQWVTSLLQSVAGRGAD